MAANPWSLTSLVNASVVKTNTPDEIAAIKEINRRRYCMVRQGIGNVNWATSGSPPEVVVPLMNLSNVITLDAGSSYGVAGITTGAWQPGRDGYYRISGFCKRFFFNSGAACAIGVQKSSNLGSTWTGIALQGYRPDPTDFGTLFFDGFVDLLTSDLVRVAQSMTLVSGSASGSTSDPNSFSSQTMIEYIRPITLPA